MKNYLLLTILTLTGLGAFAQNSPDPQAPPKGAAADSRIFEICSYHVKGGKIEELMDQFQNHTLKLYAKHHIDVVGCWISRTESGMYQNILYTILAFPSIGAHDTALSEINADPEFMKVEGASKGKLYLSVNTFLMSATQFSAIK